MFDLTKFIYFKHNSITKELCNEVIDIYETSKLVINDNSIDNSNYYNIIDSAYGKLKAFLKYELSKHLKIYETSINSKSCKILHLSKNENTKFYIREIELKETTTVNQRFNWYNDGVKVLTFMWFLNDCEICFWDSFPIKISQGMIIIFPSSWCFPYYINKQSNVSNYVIFGDIYNREHHMKGMNK
jgi:hypothetical protein